MNNIYKITQCNFILSTSNIKYIPLNKTPHIAFIGKSNVGKSTLINYLSQKKNLAKCSKKPGKTNNINIFSAILQKNVMNKLEKKNLYIIDLPGYGYSQKGFYAKKKI